MESTACAVALEKPTKQERWRKYDRDYKIIKYHTDEEFRQKTCLRALASYYRRKHARVCAPTPLEKAAAAAPASNI